MFKNILYLSISGMIILSCMYCGFEAVRIYHLSENGAALSLSTKKFERDIAGRKKILILGDSLAYGVGASSQKTSFAGKISEHYKELSIVNNAKIGETVASLKDSLDEKVSEEYETIFIIVGGNDIMRMHINVYNSANSIESIIDKSSRHSKKVVLITTGNFNYVSLNPWILKSVFNARANAIRHAALRLESNFPSFRYVDFSTYPISKKDYKTYEATDGYHLNDLGVNRLVSAALE